MRAALVTGTSRGIGAATARALLEGNWTVFGVARGAAPVDLDGESRYRHHRLDLSDLDALAAWAEGPFSESVGDLQRFALINNAGTLAAMKPLARISPAEWRDALAVNLAAPAWLTGFAIRRFRHVPLRVIDLSSGAATAAYPSWGPYCTGKAALRMLGQVAAQEVEEVAESRHPNAAFVSYAPNVVSTRMQEEIRATDETSFPRRARFVALYEQDQLHRPEGPAAEIAALADADDLTRWSERLYQP